MAKSLSERIEGEKLLTTGEIADYINTSEKTIIRLREKKELPAYKIGGQYRYRDSEVIAGLLEKKFKNDAGAAEYSNFSMHYDEAGKPFPLITNKDVAKILRTSVRTVSRLIKKDLTGFRVGGQMRFDGLLLEKWVIKHKYKK